MKGWDVDIHAITNDGANAVHIAAEQGQLKVLRELRSWNFDIHATSFEMAVINGEKIGG